jgi:putative FmdB family regulatory protein
MPIYEYTCQDCGQQFEKLVRVTSDQAVTCPSCQSDKCNKSISLCCSSRTGSVSTGSSASCAPSG